MSGIDPATADEVRSAIDDLLAARLPAHSWDEVADDLPAMRRAVRSGDERAIRAALVPVSRAAFEAKVRTRLGPRRPPAALVVPTKRTPALPIVGAICGAILLALGWQLGGGLVLAGTAALALLVLGVAIAGMRVGTERTASTASERDDVDERVPAPADVRQELERLRSLVTPE